MSVTHSEPIVRRVLEHLIAAADAEGVEMIRVADLRRALNPPAHANGHTNGNLPQ